jgi:O-antigen ligase
MMGLSFSLLLVGFLVSQTSWWTTTWHHLGQAWSTNPLEDPSIRYRFWRVEAAWQVFREMPWVGAGPGGSGAYLVEHPEISDLKSHLTPESFEFLRRDPLSQNLFTELLSEWGVFGTLFFFWGLCSLLGVRRYSNWLGLAMLVVIYSASQTLARFDLWFMISVLAWLKRKV